MTPRRDTGDGSVYQDATGRWRGYVTVGWDPDGKQRRRYVSGPTRRVVLGKLAEARDQRDAGVETTKGTSTGEWLEHWLTNIAALTVRPSTLEGYTTAVRYWAVPSIGKVKLDRLTPEHLENLYTMMVTTGKPRKPDGGPIPVSVGTVKATHRALSRALEVAYERRRISRNPAKSAYLPEGEPREIQPYTSTEARAILKAAEGTWNAARWSVALALGLRQGEALGLTWNHVDLGAGTITIRHGIQRISGHSLQLVPVKSRAGRRYLALPPALLTGLKAHRKAQLTARLEDGDRWRPWITRVPYPSGPEETADLVFANRNGSPIDTRADHRGWEALLKKAKVRDARLHDARHTAATLLLEQGVPARVVMEILGHSAISLTLGTYSHVTKKLAGEAAAAMETALWGPEKKPAGEKPKRKRRPRAV